MRKASEYSVLLFWKSFGISLSSVWKEYIEKKYIFIFLIFFLKCVHRYANFMHWEYCIWFIHKYLHFYLWNNVFFPWMLQCFKVWLILRLLVITKCENGNISHDNPHDYLYWDDIFMISHISFLIFFKVQNSSN